MSHHAHIASLQRFCSPKLRLRATLWLGLGGLLLAATPGCGSGAPAGSESGGTVGETLEHPDTGASNGSLRFVVDSNSGGLAQSLRLIRIQWGRLANIRDVDGVLQHRNFVVGEDITTTSDYFLDVNPVTEETSITIRYPFGTPQYDTAFRRLDQNLILVADKSLDPSELPPFPLVPRNAAMLLTFSDLLDHDTIQRETIKVLRGYPPITPFDARIVPDYNHGDLADFDGTSGMEFYTTRVIIDTTVSEIEASESNPPLPVNSLGFPASITTNQPNIALRLPTQTTSSQFEVLVNPSGHRLSFSNNGSNDPSSPTQDIVRAIRSGGSTSVTGDVNNGFLVDPFEPSVIGAQGVVLETIASSSAAHCPPNSPVGFTCDPTLPEGVFRTSLHYAIDDCASALRIGDVIQQTGVFAEVICPPGSTCLPGARVTPDPIGDLVSEIYYRIVAPVGAQLSPNQVGQLSMRYDPGSSGQQSIHLGKEPCFLRFPSQSLPPDEGVSPDSPIVVRFSEPMDPASVTPFDSLVIKSLAADNLAEPRKIVVGSISASSDLREFTFLPVVPLNHVLNQTEAYEITMGQDEQGPTDLSGNPLEGSLPPIQFTLSASAPTQRTGSLVFRFSSGDELLEEAAGGLGQTLGSEFAGQFLLDFSQGIMRSRPVSRYAGVADRSQLLPGIMQAFAPGVQTPISKLGSKLQTVWRYIDMGFGLLDAQNFNIDVEGIAWSPIGGSVVADNIDRFEISLSHSLRTPDEIFDLMSLLPTRPNSGLVTTYAENVLDPTNDPLRTVHPGPNGLPGYNVQPSDLFVSDTGTTMMPFPLNRGIPPDQYSLYTYRDTAITAVGGPESGGVDPEIFALVTVGPPFPPPTFPANQVPSIGLPILMEFRCYPDDGALGLNSFDISLANAASPRPNFRAFSTGGVNTANQVVIKNPDLEPVATGGFNPTSTPPGATTLPADNSFYIGQLDIVVRVSRVYSHWFNTNATQPGTPLYATPVVEPRPSDQPEGTQIQLHFRGATSLNSNDDLALSADALNAYGEAPGAAPTFASGNTWKTALSQLNGAQFFQVRMTFISNVASNLSPTLSALGFAYRL